MKNQYVSASFVLIMSILACNIPSNTTPVVEPSVVPVITQTSAPIQDTATPAPTSLPTDTPIPTLTATPTIPIAWPLDKGVNCRYGPGTEWAVVGGLLVGQTATIQGRNIASSWWYVVTPNDPGSPCWVAASVTNTAGNLGNLNIVDPPKASVTGSGVELEPEEISLPGCIGLVQPITIKGSIETNGPVQVKYYFETEQGGAMSAYTITFDSFGSKSIEATYTPPAGEGTFWVRIIITSPKDRVAEAKYKIVCP